MYKVVISFQNIKKNINLLSEKDIGII